MGREERMKAVIIQKFGGVEELIFTEIEKPIPLDGEVLVKIKAAGVNPVDYKIREGLLSSRLPHQFPIILGWDMAGIIEERGHASRRFELGDEVYSYTRRPIVSKGTYAEYIAIPEAYISRKPTTLSFAEAASVPLAGLTAYQTVYEKGGVCSKDTVFIMGASGGVGSFAVQFCKIFGAKVVTLSSKNNFSYLKKLGSDYTLDYSTDYISEFKNLFPQGADLVLDFVGGETQVKGFECSKPSGRYVSILALSNISLPQQYSVNFFYHFVEPNSKQLRYIKKMIDTGMLKVNLSQIFPLSKVKEAHEQISTFHTQGKVVLDISQAFYGSYSA
jgi:NADPH:quinone reductase-like Zn-dependent oxidoreductase